MVNGEGSPFSRLSTTFAKSSRILENNGGPFKEKG
jgi:hypothetical protein